MENYETLQSFEDGIHHFEKLFRLKPEIIAYDLHPNYFSSRYALERSKNESLPAVGIQHHHAHIAACMVDNHISDNEPVIGVSFDGTGYGDDGNIWGGEFLIANYQEYSRYAQFEYHPLPGGDSSTRKPYRIALAYLWTHQISWENDLFPLHSVSQDELKMINAMLENDINSPLTSSVGRLFDAIAALIGVRSEVNYEAQAAIELEAIVDKDEKRAYSLPFEDNVLKIKPLLTAVVNDIKNHSSTPSIAAKFHNGLANAVLNVCQSIHNTHHINRVVLSGGVWQNITLLETTTQLLKKAGFDVFIHHQVPTNDGGLSLGQAAIAIHQQI